MVDRQDSRNLLAYNGDLGKLGGSTSRHLRHAELGNNHGTRDENDQHTPIGQNSRSAMTLLV